MANASLVYEILLYLNSFYFGMFAFCEVGMAVLKVIHCDYTAWDSKIFMTITTVILFLEAIRIYLGRKGSLSEHGWQVITSVVITIPSAIGIYYLLIIQLYVLKLERILCALLLLLQITELAYAILFIFTTCRPQTYT